MLRYIAGLIIILFGILGCKNDPAPQTAEYTWLHKGGKTMGTTYSLKMPVSGIDDVKYKVDSILVEINNQVSTYIPSSIIAKINEGSIQYPISQEKGNHFFENLTASDEIMKETDGAFDPRVMSLVNYWGFGYTGHEAITEHDIDKIDSLLEITHAGFELETVEDGFELLRANPNTKFDFSAIAKGYAIDEIGSFLDAYKVANYMIEIGGEVLVKGRGEKNIPWRIGLSVPEVTAAVTDFELILGLENIAMATSGNYKNYRISGDGKIYAHTINPVNGMPEKNELLSTTVFAQNCMEADAYATACMVMGLAKAREFISNKKGVEAIFIYGADDGTRKTEFSDGAEAFVFKPAQTSGAPSLGH